MSQLLGHDARRHADLPVSALRATPQGTARASYGPFVGMAFTATHGSRTYRLTLTEVSRVRRNDIERRDASFDLVFSSPTPLPDATYAICRPGVPATTMFLHDARLTA